MTYKVPNYYKIITSIKEKLICFQAEKWCPKRTKGDWRVNIKQCSFTQWIFTVHTTCDSAHIKIKVFCYTTGI